MARYRRVAPARRSTERAPAAEQSTPDLRELNKADLVAEARERGLDTSGTKAEILARLEAR